VTLRENSHTQCRGVRRRFEPNRLAPAHLADAYERVVPISRRLIAAEPGPHPLSGHSLLQHQKEVA
jgi:hypothetical protein